MGLNPYKNNNNNKELNRKFLSWIRILKSKPPGLELLAAQNQLFKSCLSIQLDNWKWLGPTIRERQSQIKPNYNKIVGTTAQIKKALTYIAVNKDFRIIKCGPTWARTMDPLIMSQVL